MDNTIRAGYDGITALEKAGGSDVQSYPLLHSEFTRPAWATDPVSKTRKRKKKKEAETWLHLQALRLSCPCWRPSVGWGRKESQGRSQPVAMVYIFALLLIGLWGLVFHFTQPSCGTLALCLDKLQGLGGVPPQVSGCHPDWGRGLSLFPGGGCPGFSLM